VCWGFSLISTPVQGMALQQLRKREYHRNAVFFRALNQQQATIEGSEVVEQPFLKGCCG
jgi:hypothetical protein